MGVTGFKDGGESNGGGFRGLRGNRLRKQGGSNNFVVLHNPFQRGSSILLLAFQSQLLGVGKILEIGRGVDFEEFIDFTKLDEKLSLSHADFHKSEGHLNGLFSDKQPKS